jgi:hypothetical protein
MIKSSQPGTLNRPFKKVRRPCMDVAMTQMPKQEIKTNTRRPKKYTGGQNGEKGSRLFIRPWLATRITCAGNQECRKPDAAIPRQVDAC